MKKLKHVVLLKSGVQNGGGLEKYASRIASAFAALGAKVSILTTGNQLVQNTSPSISFYPVKTSLWPAFLRMEQFDRFAQGWIRGKPIDLVFGMDRNRFQTHIRAGNGVHICYLKSRVLTEGKWKHWMCQLNPMHRKILELEKAAFENPRLEKLFANSDMVRLEILKHYRVDPDKIEVIHNGVEWHEMEKAFSERKCASSLFAKKIQIDPDRFHFLFVGNGYLRKGLNLLLQALAKIRKYDFHLSVVGKDSNKELFEAKAIKLGLKNKVRFFGPIDDITPFYQLCDSLVIPSFYDPFANVTIEALAMGLFIVSSKKNGGHEILQAENGAIIEDLQNVDSLAEILESCLRLKKTDESAHRIRNSVKHLDFSKQLNQLIKSCE